MPRLATCWQYQLPNLPVAALYACAIHMLAALLLWQWLHLPQTVSQTRSGSAAAPQTSLSVQLGLPTKIPAAEPVALVAELPASIAELAPQQNGENQNTDIPSATQPAAVLANNTDEASQQSAADVYWPRSQLSAAPQLQTEVALSFPADFIAQQEHYQAILKLYINASGSVDRIEVEEGALPEALSQAAISAFEQARYQPGIREQNAVKAYILIEVSFDSAPMSTDNPLFLASN